MPVIACDAAGAKEFIQVSKDGLTFKEDDVNSAVVAVEGIMKDEKLFKRLENILRQKWETEICFKTCSRFFQ